MPMTASCGEMRTSCSKTSLVDGVVMSRTFFKHIVQVIAQGELARAAEERTPST